MEFRLNVGYVDRITDDNYHFTLVEEDASYEITFSGTGVRVKGMPPECNKPGFLEQCFFMYPDSVEGFDRFMEAALTSSQYNPMYLITMSSMHGGCTIHYNTGMKLHMPPYKRGLKNQFTSDLFKTCCKGNYEKKDVYELAKKYAKYSRIDGVAEILLSVLCAVGEYTKDIWSVFTAGSVYEALGF